MTRPEFKWWMCVIPAIVIGAGLVALAVFTSQAPINNVIAPAGPLDRLPVSGQSTFWAGLNYPWKTGQDFGTGGWGHSGVSDATTYQEIDADFANMAAQGVRVVKWRIFSDGRYGMQFAPDGAVAGLDNFVFADLDAAVAIARRHDMYLVFTLFSSGFWTANCQNNNVQLGGHANILVNASQRRTLIDNAVVPVVAHLASSDRVLAYEVIAEPEWGIRELNQESDQRIKLPETAVRDFITDMVSAVHRNSYALATVESNRFSNMREWQGTGVDYYSFSWYDWLEPYEPLATPASAASLDRPIVLGEYPAGGSTYYDMPHILDTAYSLGYAGAFGWSYWAGDGISDWRDVAPTFSSWVADHWGVVNVGGVARVPSPGPIQEQLYPYSVQDLAVRIDGGAVVADMKIDVPSGEAYVPHAYLYQVGTTDPLEDVRLTAAPGAPGKLEARFTSAIKGAAYSVSLGIFDPAGALHKWFNNLSTFGIDGAMLTTPHVDTLTNELGCSG